MWITEGTYHVWAAFLDRWAAGGPDDPATLPALGKDDLAGDTWARLMQRISGALDARLTAWSRTLGRELSAAGDEFAGARALNHARWGLPPIRALADAPGLPPEVREQLLAAVDRQVRSVQQQIDRQVQDLRTTGVPAAAIERRLRTVRDNPLTAVLGGPHATAGGWHAEPATPRRRRVIPDPPGA